MDNQGTPGYWGIFCPECKLFMIWLHSQRWRSQIWRFFFRPAPPPPIEFVNAAPPRKCLFWFRPPTPPPFQVILQEKCGSICQWLQLVEYSSNQTLPYIGVTNKKLSSFCLEWTTCITQENEAGWFWNFEHMELSFLWATDPNFLLSRNFGHLYRRARDWLCIQETLE